jgi:uncharacterized protein YgiM (DUF1202 family)
VVGSRLRRTLNFHVLPSNGRSFRAASPPRFPNFQEDIALMSLWLSLFVRRVLAFGFAFLMLSAAWVPASASAAEYVSVHASTANVRAQPTTRSAILWRLTAGYPLQVQQRRGKWLKVRDFEAPLGWIYATLVDRTPHRVVSAETANLRSGPGLKHRIVGKLHRYDVLRSIGRSGSWAHVRLPSGKTGWVAWSLTLGW